jgi:uncharacterized membrane protein (UPF0136 family)
MLIIDRNKNLKVVSSSKAFFELYEILRLNSANFEFSNDIERILVLATNITNIKKRKMFIMNLSVLGVDSLFTYYVYVETI